MSSQLSAQAITAHTAMTKMSISRCSTLPEQRGSSIVLRYCPKFSIDMPYAPAIASARHHTSGRGRREKFHAKPLERNLDAFDPFPGCLKLSEVFPSEFRDAVAAAIRRPDRLAVDLLTAFGSDAASEPVRAAKPGGAGNAAKGRKGRKRQIGAEAPGVAEAADSTDAGTAPPPEAGLLDPSWCVLNGAQQRNLFGVVRRLRGLVTPRDPAARRGRRGGADAEAVSLATCVRSVLEGPWQESDEKASLYLDPSLREHAYWWTDPTKDPPRSDGIANLLACRPVAAAGGASRPGRQHRAVLTLLCRYRNRRTAVSWPIWHGALGFGAARRLLLLPGITQEEPPADLAERGIAAVMRTEIYPIEGANGAKTYTHAEPVWRVTPEATSLSRAHCLPRNAGQTDRLSASIIA